MGIFSKPSQPEDPSAINPALAPDIDTEKQDAAQIELGNMGTNENGNGAEGIVPFHVTPEMEKRVLRKLDRRLVPLVMGLCAYFLGFSF